MVCGLVALGEVSQAQTEAKPAPAAQLLSSAKVRARKEHKTVLVMFHASWCGWCNLLISVMNKPEYKKLFADNYVVVSLDVSESGAKKALENPGADKLRADLGGTNTSLPFYAFTDPQGKELANSNRVPVAHGAMANIGYPAEPEEIAAFDELLKKTAPHMKAAARKSFIAYLTQTSPQRAGNANSQH